jgi:hypothetical protein
MSHREPVIRASELGQYAFCARAWWLGRVKGYRSTNVEAMRQGSQQHRVHGLSVERYHRLRRLAVTLFVLGAVALIAWLLWTLGR